MSIYKIKLKVLNLFTSILHLGLINIYQTIKNWDLNANKSYWVLTSIKYKQKVIIKSYVIKLILI